MPPVGFEPTISAGEQRAATYALDHAATGTGSNNMYVREFYLSNVKWVIKLEENKNNYLMVGTMQYKINVQFQVLMPSRNAIKDVTSCDYVIL